jgi:transcriptional regulator NrdR family protein
MMDADNRTEAGVWCRHCKNITTWTIQSTHAAEGIIRRRRCRVCRRVFRSIEIYLSGKSGNVCKDYPGIAPRRKDK